ncbi:MBL fold metallo-hydrolase [Phenylobacterium sp. LH3H17]|uniref:MBL fold metallo-hydrolase n=1 Tax=Phenylobacterium sp. LH3H17 TaxID=2903901 RepID=UPI0020C99124|nr:MBL fold metallo-hydrolase [Phenylobacterium sp. LH3H17]UTP38790.1 MBL fold metallo-hydrolase [Phenylobacterium sp. LH3H17]
MIPYVRDITFDYGACDQVSPLIRRVVANNPGPFTFLGTGTYIVGQGEVAVIDPGPDLPAHLDAILAALQPGETVSHILVTHHHSDHSPLARPLQEKTGAPIYGCAVGVQAEESTIKTEAGADYGFSPDISLCGGGAVLKGPNWTLEAIATPGHTSNHICFALHEENALFSGDHIMGWSTTVITPPDGDMTDYMESLDLVRARGFATLWPTHGPPVTEVTPFVDAYIAHRRAREAQVLAAVAEGHGRIKDMVPVLYAAVDKRLWPAAARSVLGHMIDLVRRGLVTADGEAGLDSDYRLAD